MTTTEPTSERIVVIPEVTIEAGDLRRRADNALADLREIMPLIDSVIAQALAIRTEYTQLRDVITGDGPADDDTVDEGLGKATGWTPLWEELVGLGDRLDSNRLGFVARED